MMNESRGRLATGDVSPQMGVYRFRRKIDGRTAWYAIDAAGEMAGLEVTPLGVKDSATVDLLARRVYGDRLVGSHLRVMSASSPAHHVPISPALVARFCRARLRAERAPLPTA